MTDFDDDLINDAFAGFTAAAAPSVRATGTGAVRHTVKRRRARTTAAFSVLGVLLLAAPALAYASMDRGNQGPPDVAASNSSAPSASPSASASPPPTGPDGRFTVQQLTTMKIPVASWDGNLDYCTSGSVRLPRIEDVGRTDQVRAVGLVSVVHTNLDADSATETAVLIACQPGEVRHGQLLAVDRDEAGKLVLLGVLAKGMISSVTAAPNGGVVVDISDQLVCCDTPRGYELHQIRTYGWDGSALRQLAGPTTFTPHTERIDLVASLKNVSWGPVVTLDNGAKVRVATVRLAVRNKGPVASGEFVVLPGSESEAHGAVGLQVPIPGIANGATVEVTVKIQADVSSLKDNPAPQLSVYELGTTGTAPDLNSSNNRVTVTKP
ncbi:hypothetical protein [Catellatospora citrea]|uniref:CARDB protein n=1 Tax=Catellatospora citrea TaxID=53366 RepID=A0A8J3KV48_9ACTN|nr:hypothetical protein [Catellatospora citrea]RKE08830.1 hypothetical protein C8E86_3697 [Catellatospora citrea]GIG02455.1 hypothetical protein Cci01nite_75480 [Catellatospora citrea]